MRTLGNSSRCQGLGVQAEGCKFLGLVYESSVVACAHDTRLVGSRWLSRVHLLVNLHTSVNCR